MTCKVRAIRPWLLQAAVRELLVQPNAVWYLNQLVGVGYRLDTEPELLPEVTAPHPLSDGAMPRRPKDAFYYSRLGKRQCNSVRVVVALDRVGGAIDEDGEVIFNFHTPLYILYGYLLRKSTACRFAAQLIRPTARRGRGRLQPGSGEPLRQR